MTTQSNLPQTTAEQPKKVLTLNQRLESPAIKLRFQEVLGKKSAAFVSSVISEVKTNKTLAQL